MAVPAQTLHSSGNSNRLFCILLLASLFVTVLTDETSDHTSSRPRQRERAAAQIQAGGTLRKVFDKHSAGHAIAGSRERSPDNTNIDGDEYVGLPGTNAAAAEQATLPASATEVFPSKENLLTTVAGDGMSPNLGDGGPESGDAYGEAEVEVTKDEGVAANDRPLDAQDPIQGAATSALNVSIRRMGELPGLIQSAQLHSDQALAAAQEWKARAGDALPEMVKLEDFTKQMEEKMVTGNEVVKSQVASGRGLKERHLVDLSNTTHSHLLSHSVYTRPRDRQPIIPAEEVADEETTNPRSAEPEAEEAAAEQQLEAGAVEAGGEAAAVSEPGALGKELGAEASEIPGTVDGTGVVETEASEIPEAVESRK